MASGSSGGACAAAIGATSRKSSADFIAAVLPYPPRVGQTKTRRDGERLFLRAWIEQNSSRSARHPPTRPRPGIGSARSYGRDASRFPRGSAPTRRCATASRAAGARCCPPAKRRNGRETCGSRIRANLDCVSAPTRKIAPRRGGPWCRAAGSRGSITFALPHSLVLGPRWLLPAIVGAPASSSRRSRTGPGRHRIDRMLGFAISAVVTFGTRRSARPADHVAALEDVSRRPRSSARPPRCG